MGYFTAEELAAAKNTDLTAVASRLGYTVRQAGRHHTVKEMDSVRIYGRRSWFRWSRQYDRGENGGSQIDFLRVFAGMEIKEAVSWLLDFAGYRREGGGRALAPCLAKEPPKPAGADRKNKFRLPAPAPDSRCLEGYLNGRRRISKGIIGFFLDSGLAYESAQYHNIVFKGNDREGKTRFASMRGTSDRGGGFKCDVAGSDKNYGFNVANASSDEIMVFEAAIDLMSYADIFGDLESNKLALGMLHDAPLATFLRENPQVRRICLCLDNDLPGRKAAGALKEKYGALSYEVQDCPPPGRYKDFNGWLADTRGLCREAAPSGGRGR